MLTVEPFSDGSLRRMLPCLRAAAPRVSDLTPGLLYMWQEGADIRFFVRDDTFSVCQTVGDQISFSYPVGADPYGMVGELLEYTRENSLPLRFFAVDSETLRVIGADERLRPMMSAFSRRWSDYIYAFSDVSTFAGRRYSGQRNHINRFTKLYGEPRVRLLSFADRPAVTAMLDEYEKEHPGRTLIEDMELSATRRLLDAPESFGLFGACIEVGGLIAAFSIGEVCGDTLFIHVEKALRRYEGAYPAMFRGFVRLAGEMYGGKIAYVDREDDSGDPGLRMSKLQYHPVEVRDKYLVHVHSPAFAVYGRLPVLRGKGAVLSPILERDREAYLAINTDTENNRMWGYDYREDINITQPPDADTFYESVKTDQEAGDSVNFAIRTDEDGPMIGEGIIWQFTEDGGAEIGCRVVPEYHGRGIGREAFGMLTEFAEKTLGVRCRARCLPENTASKRMIEGNGFAAAGESDGYLRFEKR